MLFGRDIDAQGAAWLVAERHPILAYPAAIDLFDQAMRDQLVFAGGVDVPAPRPKVEAVVFGVCARIGMRRGERRLLRHRLRRKCQTKGCNNCSHRLTLTDDSGPSVE